MKDIDIILIVGAIMIICVTGALLIGLRGKVKKVKKYYKCDSAGTCVRDTSGGTKYINDPSCAKKCEKPPPTKYLCNTTTGGCALDSNGTYSSKTSCLAACTAPAPGKGGGGKGKKGMSGVDIALIVLAFLGVLGLVGYLVHRARKK